MAEAKFLEPPLPTRVLHQFPKPSWIENLAVRSNGQLLVTLMSVPELWLVDPKSSEAKLVHKFDEVLGLAGIIEGKEDIFYVGGGNIDLQTYANEAGSFRVWEVDLNAFDKDSKAGIKQVAHLAGTGLPNGFETLSREDGTFLVADSELGAVWKVNVNDGTSENVIDVEEMKFAPPPALSLGINGIKIRDGYLYWSNTSKNTICRVKIDENGKAVGDVEVVVEHLNVDDFVFDKAGNGYFATNVWNSVVVVKPNEKEYVTVAGKQNEFTVAGSTAVQFGRGKEDGHILYVTTAGAMAYPIGGEIEGGKVVAVDTTQIHA